MRSIKFTAIALVAMLSAVAIPALAQVMVGGAPMYSSKDIVDNAVNSKDHTTLVAAVQAAGLVPTLKGAGPFTVFAPTNAAFAALPAGTVDTLLKPENKPALTKVLTYHVVAGKMDSAALIKAIDAGSASKAWLVGAKTVNGPAPFSVGTRPAALTAATSVVWSLELTALSTMSLLEYIGAPPTMTCAIAGMAMAERVAARAMALNLMTSFMACPEWLKEV